MKKKNRDKLKEIVRQFWFYKIFSFLFKDRSKCPSCQKNPMDKEYPGNMCFHCYYKSLTKKKYKKDSLKGGVKDKMSNLQKPGEKESKDMAQETYKANCLKCKKEIIVLNPQLCMINGKGGSKRKCVKGLCPTCNKGVFRILKKQK